MLISSVCCFLLQVSMEVCHEISIEMVKTPSSPPPSPTKSKKGKGKPKKAKDVSVSMVMKSQVIFNNNQKMFRKMLLAFAIMLMTPHGERLMKFASC